MHLINAVALIRIATRNINTAVSPQLKLFASESAVIEFGTFLWFLYAGISCLLVLFAGIMSGLTLGLMSLGLVELEILQRSGTSSEKEQAGTYTPHIYR